MNKEQIEDVYGLFRYNFNRLLTLNGYKQSGFAEVSGLTPATVSTYANGKRIPGGENLHRLAEFFGVTVSEFFKTPQELRDDERNNASRKTLVTIGDTSSASTLKDRIAQFDGENANDQFLLNVTTDAFHPYAVNGDELCCSLPLAVSSGQMILIARNNALMMGRIYENANGYLFVSEKRAPFPIFIRSGEKDSEILAIVQSCKHAF